MADKDDTEFELDLDQVFTRDSGTSVAPPAPSPDARSLKPGTSDDSKRPAHKFTHKDGNSLKSISRILTRPSTRIAAEAAVARTLDEEILGAEPKSAPQKKLRGEGSVPELRPNKAHSILADVHENEDLYAPEPRDFGKLLKVCGFLGLCALLAIMFWRYWRAAQPEKLDQAQAEGAMAEIPIDQRIRLASGTVDRYLAAQGIEEKLQHVLEPDRVRPTMEKYYGEGGADPVVDAPSKRSLQPQKIGELYWFGFELKSTGSDLPVRIRVNESALGEYRLDWEDFVAPGAMGWEAFLKNKPQSATQMRVNVKLGEIYGGIYGEEKFNCYMISHLAGGLKLYGYVEKTHRAAQAIQEAVNSEPQGATMTLYLMFEKDSGVEQVRIVDLVSEWKQF